MWTGLGVIFIICALAWPVIKFIGMALIGGIGGATGQQYTQEKIDKAKEEEEHQALLDKQRIMTSDYRKWKMNEKPTTVVVGEKYEYRKEWNDKKMGWVFPFTVKYPWYYWKRKKEQFIAYSSNYTKENGFTQDIYEYIQNVEFVDDCDPKVWCKENYIFVGPRDIATENKDYIRERERECERYCEAISTLAYRYVYFGAYTEFRTAFIRLLMRNRDITLKFIRECHAANEWRKDYNQMYDCDNYLKDFMRENRIKEKIDTIMGHSVFIPDDLRYYKPNTTDSSAAQHIKHEQEKRGWHSEAAKSELSSQKRSGLSAVMLVALIIAVVLFFANVGTMGQVAAHLSVLGILIGIAIWAMTLYGSCADQEHSDDIRQAEKDEDNYKNPLPEHTNNLGKQYAKELYNEIMQHPAPYKYYEEQT